MFDDIMRDKSVTDIFPSDPTKLSQKAVYHMNTNS